MGLGVGIDSCHPHYGDDYVNSWVGFVCASDTGAVEGDNEAVIGDDAGCLEEICGAGQEVEQIRAAFVLEPVDGHEVDG